MAVPDALDDMLDRPSELAKQFDRVADAYDARPNRPGRRPGPGFIRNPDVILRHSEAEGFRKSIRHT